MDEYELPASYGRTRLVLLPVDPYQIHAYWEVTPNELREAQEQAGKDAQAVLRFYSAGKTSGTPPGDFFDVEIDLRSRNWYADLWSTLESCYADLALRKSDGTLIRLVRSRVVQFPRGQPVMEIRQTFAKVETTGRPELVPPPPRLGRPEEKVVADRAGKVVVRQPPPKRVDSQEIVKEMLKKVYASLRWPGSRITRPAPEVANVDLTDMAEEKLATGISSSETQTSRMEAGSDSKK